MVSAQGYFPSIDSLRRYIDRYIRNSAIEAFTNLRLNTALKGLAQYSGTGGVGVGGLDTLNDADVNFTRITGSDVVPGQIGNVVEKVRGRPFSATAPTSINDVWKWDGAQYIPAPDSVQWGVRSSIISASTVNNKRLDASSVTKLPDGRLFVAFDRFGNVSGDSDTSRLYAAYSSDNGRTWGTPFLVVADTGPGDYIPSLYQHGDTVKMIYLHGVTLSTNEIRQRYSLDNGLTWSASTTIYGSGLGKYYSPAAHRVERLLSGDLLYTFCENNSPGDLGSQTGTYFTRFIRSVNHGTTWTAVTNTVTSPDGLSVEGGTIQIEDGTIILYYRARSGWMNISKSVDNGVTWSTSVPSGATCAQQHYFNVL